MIGYTRKFGLGLLIGCSLLLGILIFLSVTNSTVLAIIPDYLHILLTLVVIFSLCASVSLIYFHSSSEKRNRIIWIFSSIAVGFFVFAFMSKLMNWFGAALELILSIFLFTGAVLPLIVKNRYEKRKGVTNSKTLLLNFIDLFSVVFICMGFLFRVLHWPGSGILLPVGFILLFTGIILWNISFRSEVKSRLAAEDQLKITLQDIAEKNKEIMDSINYAKRLQEAIFPSLNFITDTVPNNFVLYRPKDVIAGDFYWAERINDTFLLAVADCTGHGVPGALVSVVCSNALNRSVKEFKLTTPGEILDKTKELVVESFSRKGEIVKDGMDISLLSIQGNKWTWSGANNPLWQIKNNDPTTIHEIKGNKQAIGYSEVVQSFETHEVLVEPGDILYLFTDGFADQFGGDKGKKFKYKPLKELFLQHSHLPLHEQKEIIERHFLAWKGDLDQVDDLCVLGIKIQ